MAVQVATTCSGSHSVAAGTHTVVVSATDIAGNQGSDTRTHTVVSDTTPPVITPTVTGTLGNNGWYKSNVSVSWTVTDPDSAITSTTGCGTTDITSDTAGMTLTCSATSSGGTSSQSVIVKRDATAPTATATPSPAANANGWNNTEVTVTFTGNDSLSGIDFCTTAAVLSSEGAVNRHDT